MRPLFARFGQALLLGGIFLTTLLLNLPLGALSAPLATLLPPGIGLERPTGRLLEGQARALLIEPSPGWPLRLSTPRWRIGLDDWRPGLRLEFADGWALDARLRGFGIDWWLRGGGLGMIDTSRLPPGVREGVTGELGGRLTGRLGITGCGETSGGLSGQALALRIPETVPLGQARLTLACEHGRDQWRLELEDSPHLARELRQSLLGGTGTLSGQLGAEHPLFTYARLLDASLSPGEQSRHW